MEEEEHCSPEVVLCASDLVRRIQLSLVLKEEVDSFNIYDFVKTLPEDNAKSIDRSNFQDNKINIVSDQPDQNQEITLESERLRSISSIATRKISFG